MDTIEIPHKIYYPFEIYAFLYNIENLIAHILKKSSYVFLKRTPLESPGGGQWKNIPAEEA